MNIPGAQQGQRTADAGLTPRGGVVYKTGDSTDHEIVYMTTDQRSWVVVTDGSKNLTLTLPPVAQAGGMMFFFYIVTGAGGNLVIDDDGDDADFSAVTIATTNDAFICTSDGIHWFAMNGGDTS